MFRVTTCTPFSEISMTVLGDIIDVENYVNQYLPPAWLKRGSIALNNIDIYVNKISGQLLSSRIDLRGYEEQAEIIKVFDRNHYNLIEVAQKRILINNDETHFIECLYSKGGDFPYQIDVYVNETRGDLIPKIVLRIIRDLLQKQCHLDEGIMLHGSTITKKNGHSIVFLANKGSGKTSWMLKMLKHGWHFLGNDRLFLFVDDKQDTPKIIPYPIAAMLSQENLINLPDI